MQMQISMKIPPCAFAKAFIILFRIWEIVNVFFSPIVNVDDIHFPVCP